MRTIGITGGTGFVGKHLTRLLKSNGYGVVIFTRKPEKKTSKGGVQYCYWNPEEKKCDLTCIKELDAIVHLAGAGIADKRWTEKRKKEIVSSRVDGTNFLISQLREHGVKCRTLVSASAIGYYGPDRNGEAFTETDKHKNDFLGNTCYKWEQAAMQAADTIRTVILRFGIVLGKEAGAFKEFHRPLKAGVKPIFGNGRQMVSWVHVEDLAALILKALQDGNISGVYNAVSPKPVSNRELMNTIAREKGGIAIPAPAPAFALKLILGELSTEILKSCTVSDKKVRNAGFTFRYPDIHSCVKNLLEDRTHLEV